MVDGFRSPVRLFELDGWLTLEQLEPFPVRGSSKPSRRAHAIVDDQDVHRLASGGSLSLISSALLPTRGRATVGLIIATLLDPPRSRWAPSNPSAHAVSTRRSSLLDLSHRLRHETCQRCCRATDHSNTLNHALAARFPVMPSCSARPRPNAALRQSSCFPPCSQRRNSRVSSSVALTSVRRVHCPTTSPSPWSPRRLASPHIFLAALCASRSPLFALSHETDRSQGALFRPFPYMSSCVSSARDKGPGSAFADMEHQLDSRFALAWSVPRR